MGVKVTGTIRVADVAKGASRYGKDVRIGYKIGRKDFRDDEHAVRTDDRGHYEFVVADADLEDLPDEDRTLEILPFEDGPLAGHVPVNRDEGRVELTKDQQPVEMKPLWYAPAPAVPPAAEQLDELDKFIAGIERAIKSRSTMNVRIADKVIEAVDKLGRQVTTEADRVVDHLSSDPWRVEVAADLNGHATGSVTRDSTELVEGAMRRILRYRGRLDDAGGVGNALAQSFVVVEEGSERSVRYEPEGSINGRILDGLTGPPSSLSARASAVVRDVRQTLPRVDPIDPDADLEDVRILRRNILSELDSLEAAMASPTGPPRRYVDNIFDRLLGSRNGNLDAAAVEGLFGDLRELCGFGAASTLVNRREEHDIHERFRFMVEQVVDLRSRWAASSTSDSFGVRLARLEEQLGIIRETREELERRLRSAEVGPAERRRRKLTENGQSSVTMAELLSEVDELIDVVAPRLLRDGEHAALDSILRARARSIISAIPKDGMPSWVTRRVQDSLLQLRGEFSELRDLVPRQQNKQNKQKKQKKRVP